MDESLSAKDEATVSAHIAECTKCKRELTFYEKLRADASEMDTKSPPAYLWERISLQLEEHPWGEEGNPENKFWRKYLPGMMDFREANISGVLVSIILITFLCLFPGLSTIQDSSDFPTQVQAKAYDANLHYLSLYMIANGDIFPEPVREFYLAQLNALDGKIRMIKDVLGRFPENRLIKAQLAAAYAQKLALYRRIGNRDEERLHITEDENYFSKGSVYD
jgi:hypothetical protein